MGDSKGDYAREFFISYTQADRAWAEWLAWELEAASYTTLLQAWDMPAGTSFLHIMDQAVRTTEHTVVVLSPAYLRSEFGEAEWRPGFRMDPSGERRVLIPVRVEQCELEGLLADRVWIDLVGLDEASARARLREEIAGVLRGHRRPVDRPRFPGRPAQIAAARPRFPTALPPVWNVPFRRNPTFTGRDDVLIRVAGELGQGHAVAVTQVLQGGGGVGKTSVAVEYAYRQRAAFDTVWWVRAEEPATLVGDYIELADALGIDQANLSDQDQVVTAVRRWLADHDRWLLILDNAPDPEATTGLYEPLARLVDLLPQVIQGQVLVTSRDIRWDQHATLAELEVFTPSEAVAFLLARSGSIDQQTAGEIAVLLGYLPLALEQAGAYVRETGISLAGYLDRLRQFPGFTLAKGHPRDRDPADTVATIWQVSMDRVRSITGTVALLEICAFLGSDDIPRELFVLQVDSRPQELAFLAEDPFALDEAVAGLRRYGLIKASEEALSIHRLLQQIIRDGLEPSIAATRVSTAVDLLAKSFPWRTRRQPDAWPTCVRLLPHAVAALGYADQHVIETEGMLHLLDSVADYLSGQGRHGEARTLQERTVALAKAVYGHEHLMTGFYMNNLGTTLVDAGDPSAARTVLEQSLAIQEAAGLLEDPETGTVLSNLGTALHSLGDLVGARECLERGLAIAEGGLEPNDYQIAITLDNLANVLAELGDPPGARKHLERDLSITESTFGPNHPEVAVTLVSLGSVLYDQADLAGARKYYERALDIERGSLGSDHPEIAVTMTFIAEVLTQLGDLGPARNYLQTAHGILEASLGPTHPRTQHAANLLAALERQ